MCGIAGHLVARGQADLARVERMNAALHHRGPDDGGVRDLGFAALGMRRLAIVDLARGAQPMASPAGDHTLVYNGELYDLEPLRERLRGLGVDFRTTSDTEVLLQALLHWGEGALAKLNGMYAFALANEREGRVLCARDPLGIKPFYYYHAPSGELIFSSELASLLSHPAVPRRLDRRSLQSLLQDRFVADPFTLLEGVRRLPPGHLLEWQAGTLRVEPFWELAFDPQPMGEAEALDELRALLDETTRSHLEADVPVGILLSGGIDSATVAAYASRHSDRPLESFSVGFRGEDDERPLARAVAQHLGTHHHELAMEDVPCEPDLVDRLLDHLGEPMGDTSAIPTWIVSNFAAEHVKTVLSGDGGDELFGGYDHMRWAARIARVAEGTPRLARQVGSALMAGLAPLAPGPVAGRARRLHKGLSLSLRPRDEHLRGLMALWSPDELDALLHEGVRPHGWLPEATRRELAAPGLEPEERAMVELSRTYLPGAILRKVDRTSMAQSLEVRVPLLDQRVVEFAARLPLDLKLRDGRGKYLLRESGRALLPPELYGAKKRGFTVPLERWLDDGFWALAHDLLGPGTRAAELFQAPALERTLVDAKEREASSTRARRVSKPAALARAWLLVLVARWLERLEVSVA